MQITDAISITELSRLSQKSRPTIYKYIQDFEQGNVEAIPYLFQELFGKIQDDEISYEQIKEYCATHFGNEEADLLPQTRKAISFLKENQHRIDFEKLEKLLRKVTH